MNKHVVDTALQQASFRFAKSMPNIPHEYSHRNTWSDDKLFCDIVLYIREHGIEERFYSKKFIYYYANGYKYWTMGNPVSYIDKSKTFILNRAKIWVKLFLMVNTYFCMGTFSMVE